MGKKKPYNYRVTIYGKNGIIVSEIFKNVSMNIKDKWITGIDKNGLETTYCFCDHVAIIKEIKK